MKRSINHNQRSKRQEVFLKKKNEEFSIKNKLVSIKKLICENKLSTALNEVEELLQEYPDDSIGLFQHANILYILGELDLAKEEFQNIVNQNLESKNGALYKLGNIAVLEKNYKLAKELFRRNIEESTYEEVLSVIALSNLELRDGNFSSAEAILNIYPNIDNDRIVLQRALILKNKGKCKEAYNLINTHHFEKNEYIVKDLYYLKASLESDLKLYNLSDDSFSMILDGSKSDFYYRVLSEYNILNYRQRNYQKAISGCMEVINYSNNDNYVRKSLITLGNIYKMLGNIDLARKYYLESLSIDCKEGKLGYIYLADLAMIEKEYDKAKDYIKKFVSNSHNKVNENMANIRFALITAKTNDIRKCQEFMEKIDTEYLTVFNKEDYYTLKDYLEFITRSKKHSRGLYTYSQIKRYNLYKLKEHIDKVHTCDNGDTSIFSKDIDLDLLILQVPELIKKGNLIGNHYFELYEANYDNIGFVNGEVSNTLRLVVFPETEMVITMFPVKDIVLYNEEKNNVKKKSQIDKFNKRYNKIIEY